MQYSIAALLSVAALAGAAPTAPPERDDVFFSLRGIRSGSPIQNGAVNANAYQFWIGKDTAAACKPGNTECQNDDITVFVSTSVSGRVQLQLYSSPELPAQRVWVNKVDASPRPLYFTAPGVSPPATGERNFDLSERYLDGAVDGLGGFFACEGEGEDAGKYRIAVSDGEDVPDSCIPLALARDKYDGGVPVYEYV